MARARAENLPNIPHTLDELRAILKDPQYAHLTKSLSDGNDSVYAGTFGSSEEGTRCVVFTSKFQRKYLQRRKKVFSDATFDPVPAGLECRQIWNIVTVRRGRVSK